MKKIVVLLTLLLLGALLLTGCGCKHENWVAANCETPKTCADCGETQGEALGHNWKDAACEKAKTCALCGETEGSALGHSWQEATTEAPKTCSNCGKTEGEKIITDPRFHTTACAPLVEIAKQMQDESEGNAADA